jgi:hypothetical protein
LGWSGTESTINEATYWLNQTALDYDDVFGSISLEMSMYKIAEENMDLKMCCPKCGYADRMKFTCGIAQNYRNVTSK